LSAVRDKQILNIIMAYPTKPVQPAVKKRVRTIAYTIHLYGGLLCVPYLIIFGLSSLDFNHHFLPKAKQPATNWVASFTPKPELDDTAATAWIRDNLDLIGWIPRAQLRRIDAANVQFKVLHPGKTYLVRAQLTDGRAEVEEVGNSWGYLVVALHGNRGVPASKLMNFWAYYGQFCALLVTFSAVSGVYLWLEAGRDRFSGTVIMAVALALSLAFLWWII